MNTFRNNKVVLVSGLYFAFYALILICGFVGHLAFTIDRIQNIVIAGGVFVPLVPLLWFAYIERMWLRILLYAIYGPIAALVFLFVSLGVLFIALDILSGQDSGLRQVYERPLPQNRVLAIYRMPDAGALGGDEIRAAVVRHIAPGIIRRKYLPETAFVSYTESDSAYVLVGNIRYPVPNETALRKIRKPTESYKFAP